MFSDPKYQGDHSSVGEELMMNIFKLEEKGAVVDKVVREGYFNFPEALSAYRVSEIEYVAYLLLKSQASKLCMSWKLSSIIHH